MGGGGQQAATVCVLRLVASAAVEVAERRCDVVDAGHQEDVGEAECRGAADKGRDGAQEVDQVADPAVYADAKDGIEY